MVRYSFFVLSVCICQLNHSEAPLNIHIKQNVSIACRVFFAKML